MKAAVYSRYGPSLEIRDVEKPVPNDDEVLIKVRAASVNPLDYHLSRHPFILRMASRLSKLKITRPGRDVAGLVEVVGSNVTQFKLGDAVFGSCDGTFAEFACAPASAFARKPENITFEQAASVPVAGLTALQGLRDKGKLQSGQKVLINGAAGGVGTFAVQIAKWLGAKVTAVCSTRNVEMVRSIGADRVIDYTREDFTRGAQRYDLIFDLVANHSFSAHRRVLNSKGIYIGAGLLGKPSMFGLLASQTIDLVLSRFVSQEFGSFMAKLKQADLVILGELMEARTVTPVIDRTYLLSEVDEAIRYLEQKHARGKVVIAMDHVNGT